MDKIKWAIKITKENREELKNWVTNQKDYDKKYNKFYIDDYVVSKHGSDNSYQYYSSIQDNNTSKGYTIIDLQEFRKLTWIPKIGDKVKIPKTKSIGTSINVCSVIYTALKKSQDYLYFTKRIDNNYVLDTILSNTGDYFSIEDLEPYEEPEPFVLPENWYVITTEDNINMLSKWRFSDGSKLILNQLAGIYYNKRKNIYHKEHNKDIIEYFGIEITTEQFKQYVLISEKFLLPLPGL